MPEGRPDSRGFGCGGGRAGLPAAAGSSGPASWGPLLVACRDAGRPPPVRGRPARPLRAGYGLMAKLRVVQPALEALPPGAASIELPQTWPVVPVAGAAGSGVAAA